MSEQVDMLLKEVTSLRESHELTQKMMRESAETYHSGVSAVQKMFTGGSTRGLMLGNDGAAMGTVSLPMGTQTKSLGKEFAGFLTDVWYL